MVKIICHHHCIYNAIMLFLALTFDRRWIFYQESSSHEWTFHETVCTKIMTVRQERSYNSKHGLTIFSSPHLFDGKYSTRSGHVMFRTGEGRMNARNLPVLFSEDGTLWQDEQHKSPANSSHLDSSVNLFGIIWNNEKQIELTTV